MADYHFVTELAALLHSTVNDHRFFKKRGTMTLSCTGWVASRLALPHFSLITVKFQELISAFSDLPLLVEHVASTEYVNLVVKGDRGVTLAPLNWLSAGVCYPFPLDMSTVNFGFWDFFTCAKVESSNQINIISHSGQSGTLSRSWDPLCIKRLPDHDPEIFSFLHALDIALKAAH